MAYLFVKNEEIQTFNILLAILVAFIVLPLIKAITSLFSPRSTQLQMCIIFINCKAEKS